MERTELTGIERQLVLEYLMDGNAAVTLSFAKNADDYAGDKNVVSAEFPVALRAEQLMVLEQGVILLKNVPAAAADFEGKTVKVQFYFNRLSLFFFSKVQRVSAGLALVVPSVISKSEDRQVSERSGLSVTVYYETALQKKLNQKIDISCDFDSRFPLFVRSDYKKIVDSYLSGPENRKKDAIENRAYAPLVIYLDSERILFGARKSDMPFSSGVEYAVLVRFPIAGPIKERKVYFTCLVDEMFENYECNRLCACARISSIREEDNRFMSDKVLARSL